MPSCLSLTERDVWLPLEARKGEERLEDPWSTSSHTLAGSGPAGFGWCNSPFPNVPDGTGCGRPFSVPSSRTFGEVWSGTACSHFLGGHHCPSLGELEQWAGDQTVLLCPLKISLGFYLSVGINPSCISPEIDLCHHSGHNWRVLHTEPQTFTAFRCHCLL